MFLFRWRHGLRYPRAVRRETSWIFQSGLADSVPACQCHTAGSNAKLAAYLIFGLRMVSLLSVGMERNKHDSQKLLDRPNMISEACSHGWCPLLPACLF